MKLIVDTNIIISALIKDSTPRKIITHAKIEFYSVGISKKELNRHKDLILKKAKISDFELELIMEKLFSKIIVLDDEIIKTKMKEAKKIMDKIDPNDTHLIAASLSIKAPIWSNDNHFSMQNKVKVYKTEDLVRKV